jgi:hypothetical protein
MLYRKEIIMAAGTLACAAGIGFFMQQSASDVTPSADYQGAALINADASILDVEEIILTSADFAEDHISPETEDMMPVKEEHETPEVVGSVTLEEDVLQSEETFLSTCEITANARPIAAAMVNLTLDAKCLPNERVTVHHKGLIFSQTTDANGAFDITVPAMTKDATFVVAFSNGEGAVAQAIVDELADYDRVALQWKGNTGFELHAREFGAEYGSDGHVWSGASRDLSFAVTGQGGFVSMLGDLADGLMAEVYTFPIASTQGSGDVLLSVEAEVAKNNCGLEIEAQTLQTRSGNDITSRDLTVSVPDCDAAGNFLVLNNLFEDLKVASN